MHFIFILIAKQVCQNVSFRNVANVNEVDSKKKRKQLVSLFSEFPNRVEEKKNSKVSIGSNEVIDAERIKNSNRFATLHTPLRW